MSIQKYWEIGCDACFGAITHSVADRKKAAEQDMKDEGGLMYKGKHFCDKNCLEKFKSEKDGNNATDLQNQR